jgi:hypothetical protein
VTVVGELEPAGEEINPKYSFSEYIGRRPLRP